MRADIQAQAVYAFLYREAAALQSLEEKPFHLAFEIKKHGNTSEIILYQ
jgi:hypothetical protein